MFRTLPAGIPDAGAVHVSTPSVVRSPEALFQPLSVKRIAVPAARSANVKKAIVSGLTD